MLRSVNEKTGTLILTYVFPVITQAFHQVRNLSSPSSHPDQPLSQSVSVMLPCSFGSWCCKSASKTTERMRKWTQSAMTGRESLMTKLRRVFDQNKTKLHNRLLWGEKEWRVSAMDGRKLLLCGSLYYNWVSVSAWWGSKCCSLDSCEINQMERIPHHPQRGVSWFSWSSFDCRTGGTHRLGSSSRTRTSQSNPITDYSNKK